jgi:cell division septal protein FtsQ
MFSMHRTRKPKKNLRGSSTRLGRGYEFAVAQERLPVRSARRLRISRSPRVASLLLAICLLAILTHLFLSNAYYVFEVTVRNNVLVSAEEVFRETAMQGYSIFFVNPAQAAERIRALPDVRDVEVDVSLPNRMVIDLREREALVVWQAGEDRYGVDEDGLIVSLRSDATPDIAIVDLDSDPLQLGGQVDHEVARAVEEYRSLLSGVSEFEYSRANGLSYINEYGWRVYLGDGEGAELKVAILRALVQRITGQALTVEYIDVRFPESPLYRVVGESGTEP